MAASATSSGFAFSVIGALTTTFTPSPSCLTDLWGVGPSTAFLDQLGPPAILAAGCFPSDYQSISTAIYSPGVCPSGYVIACQESVSAGTFANTIATCCPSGYGCQTGNQFEYYSFFVCSSGVQSELVVSVTYTDGTNPISTEWSTFTQGLGFNARGFIVALDATTTSSQLTSSSTSSPQNSNTASSVPPPTASPTSINQVDQSSDGDGLSAGAKAGIAVGVIIGVLLLAMALFFVYRYGKRQGGFRQAPTTNPGIDKMGSNYKGEWPPSTELYSDPSAELHSNARPPELQSQALHELQHD